MLVQRYSLIHQRLLRQDIFRPKLVSGKNSGGSNETVILTPIEALLGGSSAGATKTLLGMIVQIEENRYYLEDLTGQTLLNLSQCEVLSAGYITEMCIVLVEGEWIDGIFHATKIGHPPSEPRWSTQKFLGYSKSDLFDAIPSDMEHQKLIVEEERYEGTRFVIVSDVHLDSPQVMTNLEKLFQGFTATTASSQQQQESFPIFVFMGNFTSKPVTYQEGIAYLTSLFEDFADWTSRKFPLLTQEARFIFIPGPNDLLPMGGHVLPRGPLPRIVTNSIQSKFQHIAFSSNPCRIRYFTKEIVLVRHRYQLLETHCLLPPLQEYDRTHHTIKTLLDQGHLSPLPLQSQPIYWQFDHALRLFPLPDAVILADNHVDAYCQSYIGCTAMNPGSFSNNDFLVYDPTQDTAELCQLDL